MEKSEQQKYPKGHFPLHLTIDDRQSDCNAIELLKEFIKKMAEKYSLTIVEEPSSDTTKAQAVISVPFPHREDIRIDYNIFASEMEDRFGAGLYFHMESAFE